MSTKQRRRLFSWKGWDVPDPILAKRKQLLALAKTRAKSEQKGNGDDGNVARSGRGPATMGPATASTGNAKVAKKQTDDMMDMDDD